MLQFILNDKLIKTELRSGSTVLDFVRYHKRLTGTKIGCREGDCGACTVLVGDFENGKLVYRSMTSCLMPLGNAHGKHILSVEGINMDELSPVQQTLIDTNGTQCGFCTIGFVMSLTGFVLNENDHGFEKAIASIDGNICRCTGYKSIERAAKVISDKSVIPSGSNSMAWLVENKFVPNYFLKIEERLIDLRKNNQASENNTEIPRLVLSGGTDLIVQKAHHVKKSQVQLVFDEQALNFIKLKEDRIHIGASVTVTNFAESSLIQSHFPELKRYIKLVSSTPIRNMATLAGNLVNASPIGDMTVFLLALDSDIILNNKGITRQIKLRDFYKAYKQTDKSSEEIIQEIIFNPPAKDAFFNFEKVCKRTHLDIASVNTAIQIELNDNQVVEKAHISAGGVYPYPKYLAKTAEFLKGKSLTEATIIEAQEIIQSEVAPISDARGDETYKRLLLRQLVQAHFHILKHGYRPEIKNPIPNIPDQKTEVGNRDASGHVTGRSIYTDDIPVMEGTLHLKIVDSKIAHGHITHVDFSKAEELEGVVKVFTYKDVTGENQIGGIIPDEPLLAEHEVHFQGQPILIIAAETEEIAHEAARLVEIKIDPLPVVTDPRVAQAAGSILSGSRKFIKGDVDSAFAGCAYVFEGRTESGGQEHLYLETQGAYAHPTEHNSVKIYSSTQGPTAVQRTVARVLGVGMNKVEVDVARLGGGFGGKEDQASSWGAMAALVAFVLKLPAKCVPDRMDDMRMTGKRNPYSSDFKIGFDKDLKIQAYQATFYQNGGAAADLSPAILERTLFHATNSYSIPNAHVTAHSCRTNLPPNTAFRGFGGPQGMFVIESAIDFAAKKLGVKTEDLQRKNLMDNGDVFPYGQIVAECEAQRCWDEVVGKYDLEAIKRDVEKYNSENEYSKKGLSLMPVCFGISFTNTMMNQARALVHVYSDGTVGVSTGAVEMGQSVNTKMMQVAAHYFGISLDKIKLESTNTTRVANTSPSAASATADLNGKAVVNACQQIIEQLKLTLIQVENIAENAVLEFRENQVYVNGNVSKFDWEALVQQAFMKRMNLSAKGHYATPKINFDKTKEKGHPFAYHVYGTAITLTTVDCIRGTHDIDAVHVMHDFGTSMNRSVDLGQVEGGLVQGIGWMTMEEVIYNADGRLLSNALSTYKIPDIYSVPKEINVHFLNTDNTNLAILKSKAVGEPPLMYGIGAYFSIRNAVLAFNPNSDIKYEAPITPEKVLKGLYSK
ncbi:MAG: molybdopterin cofactor-binding domain-containing protein [Bacteroidia bacterium]